MERQYVKLPSLFDSLTLRLEAGLYMIVIFRYDIALASPNLACITAAERVRKKQATSLIASLTV